jgi:hypothetical protein
VVCAVAETVGVQETKTTMTHLLNLAEQYNQLAAHSAEFAAHPHSSN